MDFFNAVFAGGGVKGIAYAGALKVLEESGVKFKKYAGASAGAIVAAFLAVGYSADELKEELNSLDFKKFEEQKVFFHFPLISDLIAIEKSLGINKTDYIEEWLYGLLLKKGKTKFKDVLDENGNSNLKMIASDLTAQKMLVFPDDLALFGIDKNNFEIAKAVRMSCSIPVYFRPYKLKDGEGKEHLIVDGGLYANYPIWIFDDDTGINTPPRRSSLSRLTLQTAKFRHINDFSSPQNCFTISGSPHNATPLNERGIKTLGFRFLKDDDKYLNLDVNFINYIKMIFNAVFEAQYVDDKIENEVVISAKVDGKVIRATDFSLTENQKNGLYENGKEAAVLFVGE